MRYVWQLASCPPALVVRTGDAVNEVSPFSKYLYSGVERVANCRERKCIGTHIDAGIPAGMMFLLPFDLPWQA